MRVKEYNKRDGTVGREAKLDAEDVFTPTFDTPFDVPNLKFPKSIIGATYNGDEITISLTPTQVKQLQEANEVKGVEFECYSYDSSYKKGCVGIRPKRAGTTEPQQQQQEEVPTETVGELVEIRENIKKWIADGVDDSKIAFTIEQQTTQTPEQVAKLIAEARNGI